VKGEVCTVLGSEFVELNAHHALCKGHERDTASATVLHVLHVQP
jgi:hypothetical protein